MDAESIAGLIGLAIGLLVLLALSIFESRTYRREHEGEGMLHHWHHTPAYAELDAPPALKG